MRTPCFVEVLELCTSRETVFEYREGKNVRKSCCNFCHHAICVNKVNSLAESVSCYSFWEFLLAALCVGNLWGDSWELN